MAVYSEEVTPNDSLTSTKWNNLRKDALERHLSGDAANLPVADGYGLLYMVTSGGDEKVYYSTGTEWKEVGHIDITELAFFLGLLGGGR